MRQMEPMAEPRVITGLLHDQTQKECAQMITISPNTEEPPHKNKSLSFVLGQTRNLTPSELSLCKNSFTIKPNQ